LRVKDFRRAHSIRRKKPNALRQYDSAGIVIFPQRSTPFARHTIILRIASPRVVTRVMA
jgi:hypothetical protein